MPQLESVLYSGQIGEGEVVKQFEATLRPFIGNPNTLSFASGTAALHTALMLAGVERGDEVISTPMTAEPTNMAVLHTRRDARVGGRRSEQRQLARSPSREKSRTGPKPSWSSITPEYRPRSARIPKSRTRTAFPVIEDAAHALGARYDGTPIGNHSEYVIFSFQAIKHMTTGDGGMLVCGAREDLPTGRRIRWFGIDRAQPQNNGRRPRSRLQVQHEQRHGRYRPGPARSDSTRCSQRHIENGAFYDEALRGLPGIQTLHATMPAPALLVLALYRPGGPS